MNILYINHYAGSPALGMEFRPYYLAKEWVKLGHKVSVIAGDYSHLRKENPEILYDLQKNAIDGVDYYWLKTGSYHGNGAKRALTMLLFCCKLFKYRKRIVSTIKPDIVISSSTYPIDSIPAHIIASGRKGVKHIHEVHDMWPSTLIEIGGMSRLNPFVVIMQIGENYAYKHADAVVSLLKYSKDYMIQHGLEPEKFHHIPNGIVTEEWANPLPLPEEHYSLLQRLRQEGKFIVGYFGGHALSNCLMTLIQSAGKMEQENVHFVLVGDGVEKEKLIEAAGNLNNISFLPPVNKRAIPSLTEFFDCIYIGAMDSPLYRFGACMNKMFDSMMAGKPIIFAINAPTTPVEEYKCGIITKPENPAEVVSAIRQLEETTVQERNEMGQRGKEAVLEKFNYEKLAVNFLEVMN